MARRSPLTTAERREVLAAWRAGDDLHAIAARHRLSARRVQQLAREAGLPARVPRVDAAERAAMRRARAAGHTVAAIARQFRRTEPTVRLHLARARAQETNAAGDVRTGRG